MDYTMLWKGLTFKLEGVDESGHFTGYANTWDVDLQGDRFLPGAFKRTIKNSKGRVPILKGHDPQLEIGMSLSLSEDETGLRFDDAVLYINDKNPKDEIPAAREEYVRMRRRLELGKPLGVSVGVTIPDGKAEWNEERRGWDVKEAVLWEFSTATFPANKGSSVEMVKSIAQLPMVAKGVASNYTTPLCDSDRRAVEQTIKILTDLVEPILTKGATQYADLPLADRETPWDAAKARLRVADWADGDMSKYGRAFFWYDSEKPDNLTSYKLPFADIISGSLKAVPRGVIAAAAAIMGSRGGVDIPESDIASVKSHIEKYYDKMGVTVPWKQDTAQFSSSPQPAAGPENTSIDPQSLHSMLKRLEDIRLRATTTGGKI